MPYWKNHQQTLCTEYQDVSFTKHNPLNSSNINSRSILNETNLNVQFRNSSIESIKSPIKSRYVPENHRFENETIRSDASRSQFYHKDIILDDDIKRSAYLFFNQQKSKILATRRSHMYLLPKIFVKIKKACQKTNSYINAQKENELKNSKSPLKQTVEKKSIFKKCKFNINDVRNQLHEEDNVAEVTEKFRQKCEAELEKLSFKIPEHFGREKCFFDLTQQEIQQFYSNPRHVKKPSQELTKQLHSQGQKKQRKFKLVQIESEGTEVDQNKKVPLFLMERLSAKDLYRSSNNSFLTDVPRMKNKTLKKPKLRHIV